MLIEVVGVMLTIDFFLMKWPIVKSVHYTTQSGKQTSIEFTQTN